MSDRREYKVYDIATHQQHNKTCVFYHLRRKSKIKLHLFNDVRCPRPGMTWSYHNGLSLGWTATNDADYKFQKIQCCVIIIIGCIL